jgi:RNA polymerase sigma-70 factor (ECF subfamily)
MNRDQDMAASGTTGSTADPAGDGAVRPEDPCARYGELESYRAYLTLVAEKAIGSDLAGKVGVSDAIQATFLAALQQARTVRSRTEPEWRAWLKAILLNHLANQRRHYAADKRQSPRNPPGTGPRKSPQPEINAVTPPSRKLMRRERDQALAAALARLPERYRQVVCWHHQDHLGFNEIAARLGISADAAQKVWGRALVRLREQLGPDHDPR